METHERVEKGHVLARLIIEMMGAPKEHIEKTLKMYIDKLKEDKRFDFISEKFVPAEQQDKMFSAFAEIEVWFPHITELIGFCFDSLPSSVEILEPTQFKLDAADLSSVLNDLQAKLHQIDMRLKKTNADNMIINAKALNLLNASIKIAVKQEPQSFEALGKLTDLKDDFLKQVLDRMVDAGELLFEGNLYKPVA